MVSIMGPPSYMWSVVDRNAITRRIHVPVMSVSRNGALYRRVDNVSFTENVSGRRRDTSPLVFRLNDDVTVELTNLAYRTTRPLPF